MPFLVRVTTVMVTTAKISTRIDKLFVRENIPNRFICVYKCTYSVDLYLICSNSNGKIHRERKLISR